MVEWLNNLSEHQVMSSAETDSTGWRPVVAFFCNILFSCNRHIVLSDSIFWFNKLGVNVGILLVYFLNRL